MPTEMSSYSRTVRERAKHPERRDSYSQAVRSRAQARADTILRLEQRVRGLMRASIVVGALIVLHAVSEALR